METQNEVINNSNVIESLGDRMKKYENNVDSQIIIKPTESFLIRLDGRSFSKFTKRFKKPFDVIFIKVMGLTTIDLIEEFEAQTGYTHSDEITLIFNSKCTELQEFEYLESKTKLTKLPNHMFNGRIQKILTLISSYCSVRFNYHLAQLIESSKSEYDSKFINLIKSQKQMFDGRILIFSESTKHEILNHQIWRSVYDCEINAISTYAYTYFGHKKIMGKNSKELIKMLQDEKNINWVQDIPLFIKHGIYCKKNIIDKEINGNKVQRHTYILKELKINFSQENLNMLVNKYWNTKTEEEIIIENNLGNELDLNLINL